MNNRWVYAALLFAMSAGAVPITYTFSWTGLSGSLNGTTFSNAPYVFTFTSDTTLLVHPSVVPVDWSTPTGTPGTFNINSGQFTGSFTDDQAVFTHPAPEDNIGIWHFNCCDWLTKGDPAFANYNLASNVSVSTGINSVIANSFFSTSAGALGLTGTTVDSLTFTAALTAPSAVPEPSTLTLLLFGVAGLIVGVARRNRHKD